MEKSPKLYEFMRPIVVFVINHFYHPQYINSEKIPVEGNAVIAGNHKFYFDPLLVDISVTKRCVYSMMWYQYYDLFPAFFRGLGTIRVKPHESHSLENAIDHLKQGNLINLFPEGQINRTDELLLPFKRGAVTMAQAANAPIIPFVIKGDWKFRSKNLRIIYGDPIDVTNMTFEEGNELLYNTLKKMLIEL